VIITDHSKFKDIDPGEISKLMRKKFIVDSRNILDQGKWRKAGFNVKVLGMTDYE
jgi:UDP-N-acetyl-D-mannosaminuronate dehydrogenase